MIITIIILSVIVITLCFERHLYKKDIQQITSTLEVISREVTNQELHSITLSKPLYDLVNGINVLVKLQKEQKHKIERDNQTFVKTISNLSHDLKTPLTSALGYAQMLDDDTIPMEKKQAYLFIIIKRLKGLSELINELLYYSQILETNKPSEITSIHVNHEIQEIISSYYDQLVEKAFEVHISMDDSPLIIHGERTIIHRILSNLLQNAISHGCERVEIRLSDKKLIIGNKVQSSDGLDPKKIFDRFYHASPSRHTKSTGLGLTITKELVNNMGKKIDATLEQDWLEITIDFG